MWSAAWVDCKEIGFSGFKKIIKNPFYPNRKIFSPKFIAWNIGSDGKIKILTIWALIKQYNSKISSRAQRKTWFATIFKDLCTVGLIEDH